MSRMTTRSQTGVTPRKPVRYDPSDSRTARMPTTQHTRGGSHPGLVRDLLKVGFVVLAYFSVSLSIVIMNKKLMNASGPSRSRFPFTLFITWAQLFIAAVLLTCASALGTRGFLPQVVPPLEFRVGKARQILPLSIVFVAMISLNNLCLAHVRVSFYQVARSLSLFFNLIFTILLLPKDKISIQTALSCLVMIAGFVVGSRYEHDLSTSGLIFGVLSSSFVALYSIYIKKGLAIVGDDHWKLMMYNTPIAIVLLAPVLWLTGELHGALGSQYLNSPQLWLQIIASGFLGFALNIVMFFLVKITSPLTNNVAGIVKACAQTYVGVVVFGEVMDLMNLLGSALTISGSAWYAAIRYSRMAMARSKSSD